MQKTREKAFKLLRERRVKKDLETDLRIHFSVKGETEMHGVIFDKIKNAWSCDCRYFSLHQKECSHILSCILLLKKLEKK
jgi:hypothetical protein